MDQLAKVVAFCIWGSVVVLVVLVFCLGLAIGRL